MSHNITLKGVNFKDLTMLGNVVSDLSNGQASLTKEASTFRTYRGQPNKCNARINLPGPHDIGLTQNQNGSYTPVFDPYQMSRVFAHPAHPGSPIGLLQQEYALREAEYEAAQQGYSSERIEGDNGMVTLEILAG